MESKKHKRERWAKDKAAGLDGEDWAKFKLKLRHPFAEVGSGKKNGPFDIFYKKKLRGRR